MPLEKSRSERLSPTIIVLIAAAALYLILLLLSPSGWLPGDPVWAIQADTLQEITDESINFFFVLPILNQLGFHAMQAPNVHPLMQAFFNFTEAWIFMFLPLLLLDPRGGRLPKVLIWSLAMFLTNVFLLPYMIARLRDNPATMPSDPGILAKLFGLTGMVIGVLAVVWACVVQPEVGGLSARWGYWAEQVAHSRVTLAFCIDLILFYIFQAWLMGAIMAMESRSRWLRFIPFWGLAIWLIAGTPRKESLNLSP